MNNPSSPPTASLNPGRVVHWETPFSDARFPAVWPLTNLEQDVELTLMVYPHGHGRYPAYVVRFESAPVIELSHEMSNSPIPCWEQAGGFNVQSSSLKWLRSPLISRHGRVGSIAIMEDYETPVQHFIIAGGDWIVHVLSTREPTIAVHEKPFVLPWIDA